jgi:DNA-binding NtrC family response regulator
MTITIIHLDDEIQVLDRFKEILSQDLFGQKIKLKQFDNEAALKKALKKTVNVDAFLLDVHLKPQKSEGIHLAALCRKLFPNTAILMCSASKDLKNVRGSLQMGADDFIDKDAMPAEITRYIEKAIKLKQQESKNEIIKTSEVGSTMAAISFRIPQIVESAVNCVYIQGESGTGKEVITAMFEKALPAGTPFIKLNCGTIPKNLIASELFGHEKGAFTGATSDKSGLIEAGHRGWIFLDEVATLPADAQVALLRAIENQSIRRLGSTKEKSVIFRVISATNEPIAELVDQGKFRKDLWQRLRETQIDLPPLRARKSEIPELVRHFCESMRGGPYNLAPTVLEALCEYSWRDGNIRELRNCLRAMTEKSIDRTLTPKSIPDHIWQGIENPMPTNNHGYTTNELSNYVSIQWKSPKRPDFEMLTDILFLEIIKLEFNKSGRMSMRGAAKSIGIPKSSIAAKVRQIIEKKVISKKDLNVMIKLSEP